MSAANLLYAKTHEWLRIETAADGGKIGTIGITDFAVAALTDLVYVELPRIGQRVQAGLPFGEVESVKAVSDLYSPVTGEITAVNSALPDHLDWLSTSPFDQGWIIQVRITDESGLADLMDRAAYDRQCAEESH